MALPSALLQSEEQHCEVRASTYWNLAISTVQRASIVPTLSCRLKRKHFGSKNSNISLEQLFLESNVFSAPIIPVLTPRLQDLLCLVTTTEIGTGGATEEVEVAVAVVSAVATVSEAVAEATVSAAAAGASVAA